MDMSGKVGNAKVLTASELTMKNALESFISALEGEQTREEILERCKEALAGLGS
jgi:hypothetical protein